MFAAFMTHARRQQYRNLGWSAVCTLSGALSLLVAVGASRSGQAALMVYALLLLGAALAWAARRSQRLAERWRDGADSERAVQLALKELARVADEIAPIPHGFRVKSARARG
jgi:hypothetical protein